MSISKHSLLSVFLLTAVSVAFLMTSNCSVFAADCGAAISGCIAANAGKPDAQGKCSAAGQTCAKTGVFVSLPGRLIRSENAGRIIPGRRATERLRRRVHSLDGLQLVSWSRRFDEPIPLPGGGKPPAL
jgi:hypothetical protein